MLSMPKAMCVRRGIVECDSLFCSSVSSFQNFLGVVIDSQIDLGTECYGKLTVCLSIPRIEGNGLLSKLTGSRLALLVKD